jgi:sulfur-carrier protein
MTVLVRLPSQLRALTGGAGEVAVVAADVRAALVAADVAHPGLAARVLDDDGRLRRFVNLFVDEEDVRFLSGLETPLLDGQILSVVPAVAGG